MKYIYVSALFLMSVSYTSCGQNQTNSPKENIKAETKDIVISPGSDERNIHTKYEYIDSIGNSDSVSADGTQKTTTSLVL